ncbi:MAG: DUF1850 domain-containing protein [Acidimicrobiia bacterium]
MSDRRAPVLAGALLFLAGLAVVAAPEARLVVSDEHGTEHLVADALTLRYRHSVERTIVEEDLAARPAGVGVTEMRFESFGAGLPSQPEWGGTFTTLPDGRLAITGMTVTLPSLELRVGEVSEQAIVAGGRVVVLASLVRPGDVLTISSVTRPRALWWLAP